VSRCTSGCQKFTWCRKKKYATKAHGVILVLIHAFFTSALVRGEWSDLRSGGFTPGERTPVIHWIGSWVDPRAGLDDKVTRKMLLLQGLELRPLPCLARTQSLYRLIVSRLPSLSERVRKEGRRQFTFL
jgi:hypothetical protein